MSPKETSAVLTSRLLSDSEKVTILLGHQHPTDTEEGVKEVARLRNLPVELVRRHLLNASKLEKEQTVELTISTLCGAYLNAVAAKFGKALQEPNLRASMTQVTKAQGLVRTHTLITAYVQGCRTLDDCRVVKFYKQFGNPKK